MHGSKKTVLSATLGIKAGNGQNPPDPDAYGAFGASNHWQPDLRSTKNQIANSHQPIGHPVGNSKPNESADVKAVQSLLSLVGLLPKAKEAMPSGILDASDDTAIKTFQRQKRNSTEDGRGRTVRDHTRKSIRV